MHPLSLTNESNRERCLDPQLWHACAGGMIQMPPLNSKVFYFPQGHAEHATGNNNVDFGDSQVVPSLILCTVSSISYMADPDTDEVFAKIILVPVKSSTHELDIINGEMMPQLGSDMNVKAAAAASFAKTLTQSDANNGGGFSVPRYCAETIFPRLDYCAEPPVQTIVAKDVHGQNWKFRHIYRGTPRRHLLTTGWSNFVNQKKLVTGDSIVFLRAENGDLCVGIRRAKKGPDKYGSGWNNFGGYYGGSSSWLLPKKSVDGYKNNVTSESVVRAASLAATGQPFEVVYYPRGSTPEFFVKASSVSSAMRTQWCSGMRFKMPFETEDSSRISWFMGTISSVQVADPILWPNSPWRLLQVAWDEPDLLQNVKRVNPWLVELVSTVPSIHLISPFPPPRKKLCVPVHPNNAVFPLIGVQHNSNPLCLISQNNPTLLSIQGARHIAHYQHTLSPPHAAKYHKLQSSGSVPQLIDYSPHHHQFPNAKFFINNNNDSSSGDNISCFDLTMGTPPPPVPTRSNFKDCSGDKKKSSTPHHILLFGQFIFTENNNNHTNSQYSCSSQSQGENNTDGHHKTSNSSGGSHQTSPAEELSSSEEQLFPVAAEEMLSLGSTLYRETNHLAAKSLTIPVRSSIIY